ncbi:MAG: GNAT family N-acetyltransferase [Acidimicrobiales bacterium]
MLGAIEESSGGRFEDIGMHLAASVSVADRGELPLAAFVAGDPPVGFVWLTLVCGRPHIEQISVIGDEGRKGIGRALLEAACRWAADAGHDAITLCTFRDVPWNGPFYGSAGFEEFDVAAWCDELRSLRDAERANGLDDLGVRVVMIRRLGARTT